MRAGTRRRLRRHLLQGDRRSVTLSPHRYWYLFGVRFSAERACIMSRSSGSYVFDVSIRFHYLMCIYKVPTSKTMRHFGNMSHFFLLVSIHTFFWSLVCLCHITSGSCKYWIYVFTLALRPLAHSAPCAPLKPLGETPGALPCGGCPPGVSVGSCDARRVPARYLSGLCVRHTRVDTYDCVIWIHFTCILYICELCDVRNFSRKFDVHLVLRFNV